MTNLNPFKKLWFWILILSIIGFIISLSTFESMGQTATNNQTPIWIWVIFGISILFWILALILYSIDVVATKRRAEIAEACGELPPPPPKKKIECPKKQCVEKKIITCQTPCETNDRYHPNDKRPDDRGLPPDHYSSVKLKPLNTSASPLNTLAPPPLSNM